ncbi:MAG: hypothetical protein LQ352_007698 [Teloschistes flavicans]|nr:MAG: hypothetical protein LQ352_007698 [Teloschistes flavicans]
MARQLHGFLKQNFGPVGLHVRAIWQKTLMSSALLKQAFTVHPGNATTCPITKRDERSSREASSPVISPGSSDEHPAPWDTTTIISPPKNSNTAEARMKGVSRGQPYVSTSTQTESTEPPNAQTFNFNDSEHDSQIDDRSEQDQYPPSRKNSLGEGSEAASINDFEQPEIRYGPSHIVTASFEGKSHLAILVTRDMIQYLDEISAEKSKLELLEGRFEKAEREVSFATHNMEYAESLIKNATSQAEVDTLQKGIEQQRSSIEKYTVRRDALESEVDRLKRNVAYFGALCQSTFRDALTHGDLLKTYVEPFDDGESDVEDSGSQFADGQIELYPNEVESSQSEVSIDELNRRAANEEVQERYAELLDAERDFDNRHQHLAEQNANLHQEVLDGACSMAQTEFDHIGFEATQMLTQNLRAAEELYEEALSRRNKLGPTDWDQESGFVDDDYDGYPLSWEEEAFAAAPKDSIHDWLEGIPEVDNVPDIMDLAQGAGNEFGQEAQEDIDTWDIRSAQMSDALSCTDWTRNRRRIDRWRKICGRTR